MSAFCSLFLLGIIGLIVFELKCNFEKLKPKNCIVNVPRSCLVRLPLGIKHTSNIARVLCHRAAEMENTMLQVKIFFYRFYQYIYIIFIENSLIC